MILLPPGSVKTYKKKTAFLMLKAAHFLAFSLSPVPRLREIRLAPPIPNKFAIPVSMTKGGIASIAPPPDSDRLSYR